MPRFIGRQQIAAIRIENGMIEHGIAARRQMQMVAALDAERDGISERTKHQSDHGPSATTTFARDHRAMGAAHHAIRRRPVRAFAHPRPENVRPCA